LWGGGLADGPTDAFLPIVDSSGIDSSGEGD